MPARDVILTAYASSERSPCAAWAKQLFREEPLVITIPGPPGAFLRTGKYWAASGDAFRMAIKELAPQHQNIQIRRRGIFTFLAGWNWADRVLISSFEQNSVDACVIMEGVHTKNLDHWINLASRAVRKEAWMLMAHGNTVSKDSNGLIYRTAVEQVPSYIHKALPEYLLHPTLPKGGVYISVSPIRDTDGRMVMPAQTKHWDQDHLVAENNRGNLYMLTYEGYERPDHTYMVEQVQPRIWRFLAEHWNTASGEPQTPLPRT